MAMKRTHIIETTRSHLRSDGYAEAITGRLTWHSNLMVILTVYCGKKKISETLHWALEDMKLKTVYFRQESQPVCNKQTMERVEEYIQIEFKNRCVKEFGEGEFNSAGYNCYTGYTANWVLT